LRARRGFLHNRRRAAAGMTAGRTPAVFLSDAVN
jgi:hypothetical protein